MFILQFKFLHSHEVSNVLGLSGATQSLLVFFFCTFRPFSGGGFDFFCSTYSFVIFYTLQVYALFGVLLFCFERHDLFEDQTEDFYLKEQVCKLP